VTDRLCVVLYGVWWCNSGPDFDPTQAVPVYPGGFVRRVAGTPHYDGARADATEPAVIAVSGIGPVHQQWVDPSQPGAAAHVIRPLPRHGRRPGGKAAAYRLACRMTAGSAKAGRWPQRLGR
jgi:hypothetical protein